MTRAAAPRFREQRWGRFEYLTHVAEHDAEHLAQFDATRRLAAGG